MSKDDIDKAVKEAEQYAESDKKRREQVDAKNNAENLVFQCEKALTDFGDKVSEWDKAPIQNKINELKDALKAENYDAIKAKSDELQKAFYDLSSKVYAQANPNGAGVDPSQFTGGNASADNNDNGDFVDADYTEE